MSDLPSPFPTLRSYIATYGGGRTSQSLAEQLGYDPLLFERIDERFQVMPLPAVEAIAAALGRPRAEVVWACGGRILTATAPGALVVDPAAFNPVPATSANGVIPAIRT